MTNDDRNNILIDLNRTGFWTDDYGIQYYGYIDQAHPYFEKGIKRMPVQVTVLDYIAIKHLIMLRFKDYFERIHFDPPFSPREMWFYGIKKINREYFRFSERIVYEDINNFWHRYGAKDIDKYFSFMESKFKRWELNPSQIS